MLFLRIYLNTDTYNYQYNHLKLYLLLSKGKSSIPQRKEILAIQRELLIDKINELNESIKYIDWKQNFYNDVLTGNIPYESYLINTTEEQ